METFWQDAGDIALRVGARVLLGALLLSQLIARGRALQEDSDSII